MASSVKNVDPVNPMPEEPAPVETEKRIVAQYIGHSGVRRVITKKDQDSLIGVSGVATRDLIWMPPNGKVDVTDVHEDVLAYLKRDPKFKVSTVEVPVSANG